MSIMSIRVLAFFIIGLAGIAVDPAEARCYYISKDGSVIFTPCHHEMPSLDGRGLPGQKAGSGSGPVEVLSMKQHDSFLEAAKVCINFGRIRCCFKDGFECGPEARLETFSRNVVAQQTQTTDIHHEDGGRSRVITYGRSNKRDNSK